jgi:cation transport ATPase
MKSNPFDVIGAITLSRATLHKMHQNLWWAAGYNTIAFPVAAGLVLPGLWAGAASRDRSYIHVRLVASGGNQRSAAQANAPGGDQSEELVADMPRWFTLADHEYS